MIKFGDKLRLTSLVEEENTLWQLFNENNEAYKYYLMVLGYFDVYQNKYFFDYLAKVILNFLKLVKLFIIQIDFFKKDLIAVLIISRLISFLIILNRSKILSFLIGLKPLIIPTDIPTSTIVQCFLPKKSILINDMFFEGGGRKV